MKKLQCKIHKKNQTRPNEVLCKILLGLLPNLAGESAEAMVAKDMLDADEFPNSICPGSPVAPPLISWEAENIFPF